MPAAPTVPSSEQSQINAEVAALKQYFSDKPAPNAVSIASYLLTTNTDGPLHRAALEIARLEHTHGNNGNLTGQSQEESDVDKIVTSLRSRGVEFDPHLGGRDRIYEGFARIIGSADAGIVR